MEQPIPPFTPPTRPLQLDGELTVFTLADLRGQPYRLRERVTEVLVIDFWSAECPISKNYDAYFNGFTKSYGAKGVEFLAIDSNQYADEGDILRTVEERDITFPILRDPDNRVVDYFGALTTPHIFVFDRAGRLRYRGAVDDRGFDNREITINYLEEVVDSLLLGRDFASRETEPFGCTIVRAWAG